ncbi:14427_t:CDS:2, partial [Dentiscutata erythropus]
PPPEIYYFLTEKDPISKVPFVDKIRAYNQIFVFTSIATDLDLDFANKKKGAYSYRIQAQIDRKHNVMKQELNRDMIENIQNVLMDLNPFVDTYISAENENLQDPLYYILIHNKHAQYPEASKTSEAKAGASDISNIDFDTLLERESQ